LDAVTLRQVFDAVYLLMLGAWGGAAVLVLLAAPDGDAARRPLGRFYALGATCGAIALPASACARLAFPEYRTPWFALQAFVLIGLILAMLAGAARLSRPEGIPNAGALRPRLLLVLAVLLGLAASQALRPPPRTRGILERRPGGAAPAGSPSLPGSAGGTGAGRLH
jgi:hypothetical protein